MVECRFFGVTVDYSDRACGVLDVEAARACEKWMMDAPAFSSPSPSLLLFLHCCCLPVHHAPAPSVHDLVPLF